MTMGPAGVSAVTVIVQGDDGMEGADGVNPGAPGLPGDDGESVAADAGSTTPVTAPLNQAPRWQPRVGFGGGGWPEPPRKPKTAGFGGALEHAAAAGRLRIQTKAGVLCFGFVIVYSPMHFSGILSVPMPETVQSAFLTR